MILAQPQLDGKCRSVWEKIVAKPFVTTWSTDGWRDSSVPPILKGGASPEVFCGPEQAAEKVLNSACPGRKVWQGLKPASLFCCSYGTTEVVP
jgi:hypothetical protein